MFQVLFIFQLFALIVLAGELIYVIFQRPSRLQIILTILILATFITLVGYAAENLAGGKEAALLAVGFSYMGKPTAIMASLMFIIEYCGYGHKIKKPFLIVWGIFSIMFSVVVFTNEYHHLYYATVAWDTTRPFSKLVMTRGPLYYAYMADVTITFSISLFLTAREFLRTKSRTGRLQIAYLFGMVGSTALGYIFYLTGLTGGYDTTMTGAALGSVFVTVLFVRHRLFDSLTLAKEQAMNQSASGLLVLNSEGKTSYSNNLVKKLMQEGLSTQELASLSEGKSIIQKNRRVYEVINNRVVDKGRVFGRTVELVDITDRFNYSTKLEHEVAIRAEELQEIYRSLLVSFAGLVEARDNSTGEHINRMKKYAEIIGRELLRRGKYAPELDEHFLACLSDVAPLHDIGKLCIPDHILTKPGKLTPEEFEIIKTHTTEGGRIAEQSLFGVEREDYAQMAKTVALYHHEKWDGSGYPEKLSGEQIPLSARIVAVADVYDAIRSKRCYKDAMSPADAQEVIREGSGKHFDPEIVDAFFSAIEEIETVAVV